MKILLGQLSKTFSTFINEYKTNKFDKNYQNRLS